MTSTALDEFAILLVRQVRDAAIRSCDRQLAAGTRTPVGARWAQALASDQPANVARTVIPDCVDETIFYLLSAIDQGVLKLSYTDDAGDIVDLGDEGLGELAGWYIGSGGWRARHSEQRFIDDFADLSGDESP